MCAHSGEKEKCGREANSRSVISGSGDQWLWPYQNFTRPDPRCGALVRQLPACAKLLLFWVLLDKQRAALRSVRVWLKKAKYGRNCCKGWWQMRAHTARLGQISRAADAIKRWKFKFPKRAPTLNCLEIEHRGRCLSRHKLVWWWHCG